MADDPKWSMPSEEQIETTVVEERVLEHFEVRHAGLMTMVFSAKWKDRDNRPWKSGPFLKLSVRNGGANVTPAIASNTIAKIVVFECERFARSKGYVVQFHVVLHGKGPDPDRDDDDEDTDEPWRHQINIRVDGTRAEQEESEVANTPSPTNASSVIDAPQPQLESQQPQPSQPQAPITETSLVEGGSRAYGSAAADFLSNALARLEAKVDFQPGQVIGEMRAVLQQQRMEHSAAARDSANVLREAVTTLVQLEVQRVATTDTVIRASTDSIMKVVSESNDNMRLVLGELLERDRRRDKKLDESLGELRDAYKQLAQAGRGETEASSKRAWAAFEEAMNMTRAAVRHEVRNEHLERELALRDQAPPPAIPKSSRSWASPFIDKIIDAFPMVALMAGSKFAEKGWTAGASAAIGFFQQLTGQPMQDSPPEGEQPPPEEPQAPPGPVHPPQPPSAGPQHVTPRNGAPQPGSNGAPPPGSNGAAAASSGAPTNGAAAQPEAPRPTAPPQRPRRPANPLVESLRRLRASLSPEQISDLQQVIPPTAWAGFETAAGAELDNVAMAALIPLGTSAQQDPTIEKHVVGLLDTEQAKLFGAITSHLKQAFGLTKPTAPPSRPQRASV